MICKCYQFIIAFVILFLIIIIIIIFSNNNNDERNSKIFSFFLAMSRVNVSLARMVENVMWKFQKLNFASSFHQYSNSCEEYFSGEEFRVGTFLSSVPIQKNSWIDQIWTKFATGSEMVFFFPCIIYKSKVSSFKNVHAVDHVLAILFYCLAFWEAIYFYGLPHGWFRPIVLDELLFYKNTI